MNEKTQLEIKHTGLVRSNEIDQQVATAHRYPRDIKAFRDEARQLMMISESLADEMIYVLPRQGKSIEGPSARFAEVLASTWRNCRAGAQVIHEDKDHIVAQGAFHDLERNVAISYEVKRRIVDKSGRRYSADMIGVTGNAACSIALRNAILKGIPKSFWSDIYEEVRQRVIGDHQSLANRRSDAMAYLQKLGVTQQQVLAKLGVKKLDEVNAEDLVTLRGIANAIKEGDSTVEEIFQERKTKAQEVLNK